MFPTLSCSTQTILQRFYFLRGDLEQEKSDSCQIHVCHDTHFLTDPRPAAPPQPVPYLLSPLSGAPARSCSARPALGFAQGGKSRLKLRAGELDVHTMFCRWRTDSDARGRDAAESSTRLHVLHWGKSLKSSKVQPRFCLFAFPWSAASPCSLQRRGKNTPKFYVLSVFKQTQQVFD